MKHVFTLTMLAAALSASSQISFEEYFDNGMPETFVLENLDGLTPDDSDLSTMADSAWTVRLISSQGFGGGQGSNAAFSVSWYEGDEGPSDDWMILPGIELGSDPYLNWTAMAITSSGNFRDRYQVFVVTEGQAIENFFLSAPIFDTGETGEEIEETARALSLSDFANQTVYIAFRNFTQGYNPDLPDGPGNGGNELAIDNIVVSEGPLSIQHFEANNIELRVWPQPAREQIRFELSEAVNYLRWSVFDLNGRMLHSEEAGMEGASQAPVRIASDAWSAGTYLLRIDTDQGHMTTPILIH